MANSALKDVEFYIVDFDRTLVDTDKMTEVFVEIAEQYKAISRSRMVRAAENGVKQTGDSFDVAGYVRDRLVAEGRSEEWEKLEKQYIHESRSLNYLLPGAADLLEWLAKSGRHFGILTYGFPQWQRMKLTAAGFNHTRHIVMEQKEKGRFISSWQRSDGTFRLPDAMGGGSASHIIMIDDKAVSFTEFPQIPSRGYWVLDPEHELPSQQGTVQENVMRFTDLPELIKTL